MDLVEPKPVLPPLQRHLELHTDFFCYQCGYNLHGQIVTRDERLDILVCRCPECGRFHPAALGVTATRPWLARLGVGLIVTWVLFVLAVFGVAGFFQGLFSYAHLEINTTRNYPQNTGGTFAPAPVYSGRLPRVIRTPNQQNAYYYEEQQNVWKIFCAITFGISVVLGGFSAIAMWHLRKNYLYFTLGWPILAALVTYGLWWASENIELIVTWSITRLFFYALLNIGGMVVGLKIGRPVARFLLRVLVSPKLRQHVHFMWTCDGLQPPGISGVSA